MLHERYNDKTFEEDIALLRLRTKVTYNKRIQPICLPPPDSPSLVERASYIAGNYQSFTNLLPCNRLI